MSDYIFFKGKIYTPEKPTRILARIPHDVERDSSHKFILGKRNGSASYRDFSETSLIPAVFRCFPDHTVPIKNYQGLLDLLWKLNPEYTYERAMDLLNDALAWCNAQWGVFDTPRFTGGAVLEVDHIADGNVFFKSIIIDQSIPPASDVLANNFSYLATSVHSDGRVGYTTRPNGYFSGSTALRSKVRMFVVSRYPLYLPVDEVHILPNGFVPPDELWLP